MWGAVVLAAAPASALASWRVEGRGWGHGVGMSQWGAHGYAQHGETHRWILEHYYQHTNVRKAGRGRIRVLLRSGQGVVKFDGAKHACGRELVPERTYRFDLERGDVILRRPDGHRMKSCGGNGTARGGEGVHVLGKGRYRGLIHANAEPGGLAVINQVAIEPYLRGVVPEEVPSEWPVEALEAQAVAARSYAIATRKSGLFDAYDDTRSQVYGGKKAETAPTDAAVRATERQVVKHDGEVAVAYFFSTAGSETENKEFGFVGSPPSPYLKSVRSPYERASPHNHWTVRFSNSEMGRRLSGLFAGAFRRVDVLRRGRSPRIVSARVVGSGGSSTVSGPTLQYRLGTRSTWMHFKRG
jgi:stage II sporulation protein D